MKSLKIFLLPLLDSLEFAWQVSRYALIEGHLKRLLEEFIEEYYHLARPHQGLNGDTAVPSAKPESAAGVSGLVSIPVVGGLHHRYI